MKTAMWKTTLREIKQSFGRFFAILAIVALGVGMFAGLKVTKAAMVETTQGYLDKHHFFDLHILSTIGFDEEDEKQFQEREDVRMAEGAISLDILCLNTSGNEFVIKAHSLPQDINGVELVKGRMPEKANECVVDSQMDTMFNIGEKITISSENTEKDKENFTFEEYTIVGQIQSSYYIQFERGNTSLGTGQVTGFIYFQPEGFELDYYTEMFVKFDQDMPLYSKEYETFIENKTATWEPFVQESTEIRFEDLLKDANQELKDGREELASKKAEAEEELENARIELEDAAEKIADGEEQLAKAKTDLADAKKTILEKTKELEEGETTLLQEEQKLIDGEKELKENEELFEKEKANINDAINKLDAAQEEITFNFNNVQTQETAMIQQEIVMLNQEQELLRQEGELNQHLLELNQYEAVLIEQFGTVPEPYASEISNGRNEIELSLSMIEFGKEEITNGKTQIEEGKKQIAEAYAEISSYQKQIDDARTQISSGELQMQQVFYQLEDGKLELQDGKKAIEEAKQTLLDGKQQLNDANQELIDGEKELAEKAVELQDGKDKYEEGLEEYNEGYEEFQTEIADAEQKISDAEQEIADLKTPDTYVLDRKTNIGYACFENDSNIVEGIANIFPVFFFLVAALVCITTMNRMVEEQRTQIGVLKALGYSESTIMFKFIFYSGTAAVLGCVFGFFGGTFLFPRVIWTVYGMMYRVEKLVYVFDGTLAFISLIVSLVCSIGTTWLTCRYELREAAAQLMRPKAPKPGKRVLLERIPFIWKRMKFLHKVSYRNIFRYKKRFFMMIIGISGCTALLVTGFGIKDSIANVANQQFEKIQIYDIDVTYKNPINKNEKQDLYDLLKDNMSDCTFALNKTVDLVKDNSSKSLSLVVLDGGEETSEFFDLHTTKEVLIPYPSKGEVVISHKIAKDLNVNEGESIVLQDENRKTIDVVVSGIHENFVYNYAFITPETYKEEYGIEPEYKTAYINLSEDADSHMISASLMKQENIAVVSVLSDMLERFESMMTSLDLIVILIIACAAGLAFIVLYNLTNINITERVREIATIKVLGFYKNETMSYVFRENVILTFIGAFVGLLLGRLLHLFVMNEIRIDAVTFDIQVKPLSYLYSLLLTFLFAWFVNLIMGNKIERISMTESLKSVD